MAAENNNAQRRTLGDYTIPSTTSCGSSIMRPTCNGDTSNAIKLRLFPFSLRDKAKQWLNSQPQGSIDVDFINPRSRQVYRIVSSNTTVKENEERKLAEQGTKFGSNSAQSPTHRRGSWRICVLQHEQTTPRHPLIKPRRGHQLSLSTHRRRSPRICVDQQPSAQEQAHSCLDVPQEA
ncbi:hypothetical protein PIB30_089921 [Stylosanthes scabra]|uniref:Uncharacterized protein n=1 Tax=Stylosanthes scabra TaxID=79078 RepID=A0ABU6YVZ5_9FABA|nr:hypothetical protein [Stylosanthes scabra]